MIVEIAGVKLEIDERSAKTVESYKVGDAVKVLLKQYSSWKVCHGVIVGFSNFKDKPTIEVLVMEDQYSSMDLKVLCVNADTEGVSIAPANDFEPAFDESVIIERFNRSIADKEAEIRSLQRKQAAFKQFFGTSRRVTKAKANG